MVKTVVLMAVLTMDEVFLLVDMGFQVVEVERKMQMEMKSTLRKVMMLTEDGEPLMEGMVLLMVVVLTRDVEMATLKMDQ